jgi:hypothetical protein
VQSIGRELEEIEETNRGTRRRRTARASMLREVQAESLVDLALALYPSYRRLRRASAAEDIVALWRDTGVWRGNDPALRNAIAAIEDPPWLPPSELSAEAALPAPGETWQWGLAPVEHTANIVLDLLGRAASLPMAGERVGELKRDFHGQLASLRSIQERSQEYWIGVGRALPDNQVPRDELEAPVRDWARFSDELGEVAHELAAITLKISEAAHELGTAEDLPTLVAPLAPPGDGGTDDCLRRLTAFDVVQRSSGADLTGIEQAVELVLMSGDVENAFTPGAAAMGKLAGLQLGHFGSFYKRSWRANDWMWGRLDGADRVVRTLVDPRRLKSLLTSGARTVDDATARLWEAATSSSNPAVREWLDGNCTADDRKAVAAEIRDLAQSDGEPLPTALGKCHSLVRQRVQLEILMDEIPSVAAAVADDERQGTAPDSAGVRWLQRIELDKPPTAEQVRRAFKACNIGTETIGGEFGSDYFTRVSTHAAAVAGAVAQQPLRRVKLLRPALAFVRGVLLTLYLLAQGVLEGSRTGAFVVALALGLGGALVALFLIGTSVPGVLLILGLTLVAAAVLLSLLRKLYLQVIGAVLVSAAVVAGFRVYSNHHPAKWLDHLAAAGAVVLLALCLMLLGRSRRARSRPAD